MVETRRIDTSGLVKGGGALTADLQLTVDAASVADVAAGLRDDAAVTPASIAPVVAQIASIAGKAAKGANTDITSLSGLTTPLSLAQGGLGATTASGGRTVLGLGDAATKNTGAGTGTLAAGDDVRITGAAQKSSNLSDLVSPATARQNIGINDAQGRVLGDAGVMTVTETGQTVPQIIADVLAGKLAKGANLTDLADPVAARGNLGLGSAATRVAGYAAGQLPPLDSNAQLPASLFSPGSSAILPFDQPTGATGDGVAADGQALADMATRLTNAAINKMGRSGYLKPGIYKCDRQIVLQPTSQQWAGLFSDGRNGAKILFTNPNSAGIKVIYPKQSGIARAACPSVTVRGISLLALFNTSDIAANGGIIPGTSIAKTSTPGGQTSGGTRLASIAFDIAFDSGAGTAASPTPSLDLDGLTIDHVTDFSIQPSTAGWAIGARVIGLNQTNIAAPVFYAMYPGSLGLLYDTIAGQISVEHYITQLEFHGDSCTGVKIGKPSNNLPLQGFVLMSPTIVISGSGGRAITVEASPTAANDIGDHLEVKGGHISVPNGIGVYGYGWGSVILEPYSLGCLKHVYLERCTRINIKGIFSGAAVSGARAVHLHDCLDDVTNADGGTLIEGIFNAFAVAPVLLTGATNGTLTRGILGSAQLLPLVEDQTGQTKNFYEGVCNNRLSCSTPANLAISDEIVNAGWVLKTGSNISGSEVIVSANITLPANASGVGKLYTFTQPVTLTLSDPASSPGASIQVQNFVNDNAVINGTRVPTELGTFKYLETV